MLWIRELGFVGESDHVEPIEDVHSLGRAKTAHGVLRCVDVSVDEAGNEKVAGIGKNSKRVFDREVEFG